jgi:ubiquinone/menaquinone biosynthesis C-methylase UbiE
MSEEALEQTRIRLGPSVSDLKLVHSTVQEMSMPDNSVDVAVWGNGIHYLNAQGQEEALRSIKRVVKPQGWFVFNSAFYQESRPPETSTFYRSQVRKAVEQLRSIGVHRQERTARPEASDFLPRSHYEELMQLVGFKIVEAKETASHMYRTAWEHISGFHQYAAGALHGYDPEAAADAMRKAVAPALEEHGTRDEHNIPYVQRNWLSIIAHA